MALSTRIAALATRVAQEFNTVRTEVDTKTTVVRWNSSTNTWPARPVGEPFGVVFLSTNDPAATAPNDPNLVSGDIWRFRDDAN